MMTSDFRPEVEI